MILDAFLLVVGFVMLIFGADYLVKGASSIARTLKMSELAIGLTIVSLGTSAPELMVNILSGTAGQSDMAIGNVIGSNVFNTLVILGVASVIYPISVSNGTVWKEIPMSLGVGLVALVLFNDEFIFGESYNQLSMVEGIVLLSLFLGFMTYVFISVKSGSDDVVVDLEVPEKTYSFTIAILLIVGGLGGLLWGGDIVVDAAVSIATDLGVSEKLIGLTIVSMGTSLPELATSAIAASKKKSDIAIGNVVGSNIFNVLLILPMGTFIGPIDFNLAMNLDLIIFIFANFLAFGYMFTSGRNQLDRWEGAVMLLLYAVYLGWNISQG